MKKGFTMIELVFVIVITGILSALALPKFIGTSNEAHNSVVRSFTGSLNRTSGATIWSRSIAEGHYGVISSYCGSISDYISIPDELEDNGDCTFTGKNGATLNITFSEGTVTIPPIWVAQ